MKDSKKAYLLNISFKIHWLNGEIFDKNYEHVPSIWKAFKMKALKDYRDLCLKVNVCFLTCVSETFRKESVNSYELDPALYLSTRGYSWDAMLRSTNVNLKPVSDIKKYQLLKVKIKP